VTGFSNPPSSVFRHAGAQTREVFVREDLVKEISKKLSEKILQEEGDLTGRITTIDADIAGIVREVGLRTSKLVIEKTRDETVAKKKPKD
jgi:hypothetical protein